VVRRQKKPITSPNIEQKTIVRVQITIKLELPGIIIGQLRIGSELKACVANIPEIYPPKPKNAAWPNEIRLPKPKTRFRPIAAIANIVTLVANVTK
tara:strand:+ start:367 stop:654 length:288 start_codon:yes stop_codon:yes gene_type:complete